MKKLLSIITAGIISLLCITSCEYHSDFDSRSCDAFLTCDYAGGLPSVTAEDSFILEGPMTDRDVEDIFYMLSEAVRPGFTEARLTIDFYDWMDSYDYTRVYDFWWVTEDSYTGDGYYAWDEIFD